MAEQFPEDIRSYADGKDQFVKDMERKALAWKATVTDIVTMQST